MPGHLINMIEALRLEIAKIKEHGGSTQSELRGGEKIGTVESTYLYRFPLHEELKNLRDDTPVRVVCSRSEVEGTIVSISKGSITVALEADLGPKIALAKLITDDSFLIEKLREKLVEIENGTVHFNYELGASVIGVEAPSSSFAEPVPQVFTNAKLNEDQKTAIRLAFGSHTSFIWGPPGTGKTTTLAHVVESYYRAGHSVLIVSNTNVAVDTALQKIAERLDKDPEFYEGTVLRHGPLGKESDERYGDHVNIDKVVERLGKDLEIQRQATQHELLEKHREAEPLREALEHLQKLKRLKSKLQQTEQSLESNESHYQDLQSKLRTGRINLNKVQGDLDRSREFGSIRRFLAGLNPKRLELELNALTRNNQNLQSAVAATSKQLSEQKLELECLRQDLVRTKASVPDYYSETKVQSLLATIDNSISQLHTKLKSIEGQLAALRQEVLNRCRILATTVYRTYLKGQVTKSFDVVVVDEASMLMLPMTFFVAGLASKAVVVAGDFRQLAPIVMSDEPLAAEWLKKDAFEKTGVSRDVNRAKHLAVLGVQYRMHPEICNCVNEFSYRDHPLKTYNGTGLDAKCFPFGNHQLLFVDTGQMQPWSAYKLGTYSRYNFCMRSSSAILRCL